MRDIRIHIYLLVLLAMFWAVSAYEAVVIKQQRALIQQMMTNPSCMVGRTQ